MCLLPTDAPCSRGFEECSHHSINTGKGQEKRLAFASRASTNTKGSFVQTRRHLPWADNLLGPTIHNDVGLPSRTSLSQSARLGGGNTGSEVPLTHGGVPFCST